MAGLALALASTGCRGIDAGVTYPSDLPDDIGKLLLTPEGKSEPGLGFGAFKVNGVEACKLADGRPIDTHSVVATLNQEDFSRFLEQQGVKLEPKKARGNLYWYDFPVKEGEKGSFLRLRLAVAPSPEQAAADLHASLHYHGPGWWGLRRANLAVLVPKGSLSEAMRFNLKYRLSCWGAMVYTGRDDVYAIPGPYAQP
jgi:hypothetical protein